MSDKEKEEQQWFDSGQIVMKEKIHAIIQQQLDSIKEARKDTTGLGMIEHVVKRILFEVKRL